MEPSKKIMISIPMAGKTPCEIMMKVDKATKYLEGLGYEVLDTYFQNHFVDNAHTNMPLFYLARSLSFMSDCDAVYFCHGWDNSRGCIIEHEAAKAYGLEMLYE